MPLPYLLGNGDADPNGPVASLHFKDDHTIVATYVIHSKDTNPRLAKRDEDKNLPLLLRAIFVDTDTGKITKTLDWPAKSRNATVVTVSDGKIVALDGDELTLYGDLQKLKSIRLPLSPVGSWGAVSSPSGKNLLLATVSMIDSDTRRAVRLWVRTDSLEIVHAWNSEPIGSVSISDDGIVLSTWCVQADCLGLEVKKESSDWKVIGPGYTKPIFVDDTTFCVLGEQIRGAWTPARLFRTDGQIVFSDKQPSAEGSHWDQPVVSSGGKRFVAPGLKSEGGNAVLDINGHVALKTLLVYDLPAVKRPQIVDVNAPRITGVMRFALSPDGFRLGVLNREILYVFDLAKQSAN